MVSQIRLKAKAYAFYLAFWGLFFLPYIAGTQFRVDQIVGALALFMVAAKVAKRPMPDVSPAISLIAFWGFLILLWAFIAVFASPGNLLLGLKLVNTFSYFAEGTAIFLLLRYRLEDEQDEFFDALMFYALIVNIIGAMMWSNTQSDLSRKVLELYGGIKDRNYEFGNIAGDSLNAGRIASIFPHSQALATFDLMIFCLSYSVMSTTPNYWRKLFAFLALIGALVGGLMTASKTFFLGFGIILALQMVSGAVSFLRRPRVSFAFALMTASFAGAVMYIYEYSRFTRDQIDVVMNADFMRIIEPRLGKEGYLVTSNTLKEMWKPVNLLFGMGRVVNDYAWSDNGFIQIITFGGIFFFVFFYGYIFSLIYLFQRYQTSIFQRMFILFFIAEFAANAGTLIYLFPRSALICTIVICAVLARGERETQIKREARGYA